MKTRRLAALALLTALVTFHTRPAAAATGLSIPIPSLMVRNGDWLSIGVANLHDVGDTTTFVTRVELGLGGAGVGLGALWTDGFGKHGNAANFGVQGKLLGTYGLTSWPVSVYAGPEVSAGAGLLKVTGGVMFDVTNAQNLHPQLGIGVGF